MYVKQSPTHLLTHTPAIPKEKKISRRTATHEFSGKREKRKEIKWDHLRHYTPPALLLWVTVCC
jgi:hypothetical protein